MIRYPLGNTNLSMDVRNGPEAKTFTSNANDILQLAYADDLTLCQVPVQLSRT